MSDFARRPTIDEIEQLRAQVRREPGSPAFVRLGEAYLALGRPQDAIEVGVPGLRDNPDSTAGRMMIGRAYVMQHQWKEAQDELLRLVKADRNHAAGFALLGEVLLRRQDLKRALPVLQHAQNLNPTNPYVEDLLKRARTGRAPDPPPPPPVPQDPQPAAAPYASASAHNDPLQFGVDEPTRVAGDMSSGLTPPPAAAPHGHAPQYPGHQSAPAPAPAPRPRQQQQAITDPGAKTIMAGAAPAAESKPPSPRPIPRALAQPAPQAAPAPAPKAEPETKKKPKVAAADMPPPGPPTGVRPRILSMDKPTDAAREAMHQAADVGDYLNALLTQGLLNVPAVQAQHTPHAYRSGKRWGHSVTRTFVFLFVLLAVGLGGGAFWIYQTEQQREEEVARHIARADTLLTTGTYNDVQEAREATASALRRDPASVSAMAKFARVETAAALLYGTPAAKGTSAMLRARKELTEEDAAWADIVFAEIASTLATLSDEAAGAPQERLGDARKTADAWLEKHPDDAWVRWLSGVAMLYANDLSGAAEAFEAAEADGEGPVVASIYRADMQTDAGDLDGASVRYEAALERAPKHPLAIIGNALVQLARAEEAAVVLGKINTTMTEDEGPRANAYRALVFALAYLWVAWDYDQFTENLAKAEGVAEPRFLGRVALAQLANGQFAAAGDTRNRIVWYVAEPEQTHPVVAAVDAELQWSSGLSAPAIEQVGDSENIRARHLVGRALFDLGRLDEAEKAFADILEFAPEDWEAQTWHAAAQLAQAKGRARNEFDETLQQIARTQANQVVRYVRGLAWQRSGDMREARRHFEESLEGVADEITELAEERANSMAYRAHAALAELDLDAGSTDKAVAHLERAVALNPAYLPAMALLGRVQVQRGQHAEAAATLKPLLEEPEIANAAVELAYAEALVGGGSPSDEARGQAREAVLRAKDKGASAEELGRVAALVDETLATEIGAGGAEEKPSRRRGRRRGRR